ncbi:MAG: TIGR03621 family F420-dependent LLM class oxidoreductase [Ilumatobacteraceae bacterium]|nr:TIGR03621 family F420-dependent LLM class oxidoreductase [Ilumatobacteraceae bacterium]
MTIRPFRFGLQSYNASSPDDWRGQARRAESHGFSTFSVADHVIGPGPALAATNHPVQDVAAIPAMAVAAEATSSIRIGSRVFCCDYRQPVMFAKELATLAFFSGGRLEIGLGAGWLAGEYDAMGVPFESAGIRIDRLEETIALIRAHMGEGEIAIDGDHVHAVGFEGVPKAPDGVPPVMIGGGSPRVLRLAGREADIVSLNFDNRSGVIGAEGMCSSTAELTDAKIDWIREGAGDRFDNLDLEIGAYFTIVTDDRDDMLAKMAPMFGLDAEQFGEHPHALVGTVDSICDELIARRERYGINYVTFGAPSLDAVAPIVERLAGS